MGHIFARTNFRDFHITCPWFNFASISFHTKKIHALGHVELISWLAERARASKNTPHRAFLLQNQRIDAIYLLRSQIIFSLIYKNDGQMFSSACFTSKLWLFYLYILNIHHWMGSRFERLDFKVSQRIWSSTSQFQNINKMSPRWLFFFPK